MPTSARSCWCPESVAVSSGADAQGRAEVVPHGCGRAKAARRRYVLNRQRCTFQQLACPRHALGKQPGPRAGAAGFLKAAVQRAWNDSGIAAPSQRLYAGS